MGVVSMMLATIKVCNILLLEMTQPTKPIEKKETQQNHIIDLNFIKNKAK